MSIKQFSIGDLVHINKIPEDSPMSHFTNDKDAIVVEYSHNSCQKGNDWEHNYGLFIKGEGSSSWYNNSNLTLIKRHQMELLEQWQEEINKEIEKKSDIDWIFENGKEVLKNADGASISTLANCLGCTNLWGSHGEGFVYYSNSLAVLRLASQFLKRSDKQGWLEFAEYYKKNVNQRKPQ